MLIPDWIFWGVPVAALVFAGIGFLVFAITGRRFDREHGRRPAGQ
jgi:cytochrome c-type biogenesis protein CcmH/NrfF